MTTSTVIPVWKKRYVALWYAFIRSEEVHKAIRPYIIKRNEHAVTDDEIRQHIIKFARKRNLPEVCHKAAIRHYTYPTPTLTDIVALIEPIEVIVSPNNSVSINIAPGVTQSDLEAFIRLDYSKHIKQTGKRFSPKKRAHEAFIIDKRVNQGESYRKIAEELLSHGVDIEEPNLRTIISDYNKRIR